MYSSNEEDNNTMDGETSSNQGPRPEDLRKFFANFAALYTWQTERRQKTEERKAQNPPDLEHGDDVELAKYLQRKMHDTVYAEGEFWRYDKRTGRRSLSTN